MDDTVVEQRIVEASALLPAFGGVTGWAALRWAGGTWFDGLARNGRDQLPVWLATGPCDLRRQPGVENSHERLGPSELDVCDGMRTTNLPRALAFEMRYATSVREAVVAADMAAQADLAEIAEMDDYLPELNGWTGIPQARKALLLADENSWSPWETRLRLIWVLDAGLPRPLCNVPVFDRRGNHLGTPDLFDPVAGVVGEYDGGLHLEGAHRARDVAREGRFRSASLEYFSVLAQDMGNTSRVVDRMIDARRRAHWLSEPGRPWVLLPTPHWHRAPTVAERRARLTARHQQSG